MPGAPTLMQGAYLTAGFTRFLPEGWINAETIIETLSLSPDSDDPRARTMSALRARMKRGAALIRLLTPLSGDSDPDSVPATPPSTGGGRRSAEEFFRQVLDQTGDGHLDWPDLAAMARELATRLDLDEPEETRLYDAFAAWWRELQAALDTDGDGRVSADEYATAVPSLAGPALIRVAEVLIDATDKDGSGSGTIDADEYRTLFRTAFHRDLAITNDTFGRSAFVGDFLSFMSGRARTLRMTPPRRCLKKSCSWWPHLQPSRHRRALRGCLRHQRSDPVAGLFTALWSESSSTAP